MRKQHLSIAGFNCLAGLFSVLVAGVLITPAVAADEAGGILQRSGVQGGLIVHLGCGDGQLTAELRAGEQYLVHGLDTDEANVATARARLLKRGVYGPVSVDTWDGVHLPYADDLVNLIVAEDAGQASRAELLRALAPGGVLLTGSAGRWKKTVKPWPAEIDEWTHFFHGPNGNPVSQDDVVAPPTRLAWLGSPRWSRHHDHMASMTSLVSAGGRLFYILDEGPRASIQLPSTWRLIARDAFNGTILWKRDIEQWNTRQYPLKSGPAHLLRRLVAIGDRVYVTLGIDAPTTVLDAATGETLTTLKGSEQTREIVVSDGVAFLLADNGPSRLPDWRRVSTYVWENTRTANPGWGWNGDARKILAYDADSGKLLWKTDAPVAPCSMCADAGRVVFHDGEKLVCLDRRSGSVVWQSDPAPTELPVETNTGPRVLIHGEVVLLAANDGKITSWSATDGRKLWEQQQRPSGHQSLKDLLVADGLVWTGSTSGSDGDGIFIGYDPVTGEAKKEFPPDVHVHWFHQRCYPSKATDNYLLTARNGTEFVDLATGHWKPNHWVRGGCIYGVMPANGMTYAPMDACGCQLEAKLSGFKALASGAIPQPGQDGLAGGARLVKGPAFGRVKGPEATAADWPTYRHDAARSGAGSSAVGAKLGQAWQAELGGRLSAPVVAAGKLFVAAVDAHTVYALDARSGEAMWSFTAGGRVDSPPTYYRGLVLFGSADGYIYALDGQSGALAWRFRGAPVDRRMTAWEQLESAWPVHGSVLVHEGVLYATAGRNMFLDGGIHFLRLDPTTGQLLGEVVWNEVDPESGEEMHLAYLKKTNGNNMPVALSDILSCDGRQIWMRSQKVDFEGKRSEIALEDVNLQPADDSHLFCQVGFLDDSWFFRTYWTFGRRVSGGYGGWLKAGRVVPSGRILTFDDTNVYGFGRKPEFMTNASVLQYQLFAADKAVTVEAIERLKKSESKINSRSDQKNASSSDWLLRRFFDREDLTAVNFPWTVDQPAIIARAMALSDDTVFVAGPPNLIDERRAYRFPDDPEVVATLQQQEQAMAGKLGGSLWAVSKSDGQVTARYAIDTIPVFDGMAVAGGRIYVSTVDGSVRCLAAGQGDSLPAIEGQPERVIWEQPEDPGYLIPAEVSKEDDFDRVIRCKIVQSDLGYKATANTKGQLGIVLRKLDKPVTGSATLKTTMLIPAKDTGMLKNGYLVFGNGAVDEKLIKCGARVRTQRAMLVEGPLEDGRTEIAAIEVVVGRPIEIVVNVDLSEQRVTCTVAGVTIESTLESPMKAVTHVGYLLDSAVAEFAPIEIRVD